MSMAEMVLIYALNHGVWKMTEEGVPQICLSVPVEAPDGTSAGQDGEAVCPLERSESGSSCAIQNADPPWWFSGLEKNSQPLGPDA